MSSSLLKSPLYFSKSFHQMESAAARIFPPPPLLLRRRVPTSLLTTLSINPNPNFPKFSLHSHSLSTSHSLSSSTPPSFSSISSSPSLSPRFQWHTTNAPSAAPSAGTRFPAVTVVVLGWLGSTPKQLRRYVDIYNSRGYNAVTFVASVGDVLSLDLGKGLEERVAELARSLAMWAEDGRERALVFHTFSNTGWLAYGAILDNLRGRHDLLMKIKGCIVDSGAEPELNPKVWAAGFVAALLKKRSSLTSSTGIAKEINGEANFSKTPDEEPFFLESILLAVFEKLFSILFSLPNVNMRLKKVLDTLTNYQPLCPQLYLYSTADKVIPSKSVESFMEQQRKIGREVRSFNFELSPHVDHYRTFPEIYSSQVLNFLKECLVTVKLS